MESDFESEWNRQWDTLEGSQAAGDACVECGEPLPDSQGRQPVGDSQVSGCEVFACPDCFPALEDRYNKWKALLIAAYDDNSHL